MTSYKDKNNSNIDTSKNAITDRYLNKIRKLKSSLNLLYLDVSF